MGVTGKSSNSMMQGPSNQVSKSSALPVIQGGPNKTHGSPNKKQSIKELYQGAPPEYAEQMQRFYPAEQANLNQPRSVPSRRQPIN